MPNQPRPGTGRSESEIAKFNANWGHWLRLVRELPDVRQDLVESVRRAMRTNSYETETILDETVRRLSDEMDAPRSARGVGRRPGRYRLATDGSR